VTAKGDREVLGLAVGDSEDGAFWTAFLRSLRARGLAGVRLVISDAHEMVLAAIRQNEEWLVGRRYLSEESLALVLAEPGVDEREEVKQLPAARPARRGVTPLRPT